MPTYEYTCQLCGNLVVITHKITENPPVICHHCFRKDVNSHMTRGVGGGLGFRFDCDMPTR